MVHFNMQAVCGVGEASLDAATKQIVLHANVLLAEICVVTAPSETNRIDRKLWRKRLGRAERCIHIVEQALEAQFTVIAVRCSLLSSVNDCYPAFQFHTNLMFC